jgi:hypothetical protein
MSLSEAIEIIEDYQAYRRGLPPYDWGQDGCIPLRFTPKIYGEALDVLLLNARATLEKNK